jgi:Tol biopolymer transport system component
MSEGTPEKRTAGDHRDTPPFSPPPPDWQSRLGLQSSPKAKTPRWGWRIVIGVALLAVIVGLLAHNSHSSGCPFAGGEAAWSPNGKMIAFTRNDSTGSHIYSLNVATRHVRRLTDSQCGDEVSPSWSPSGQWLAYQRSNGDSGIYLIRANGSSPRRIIPDASSPAWSPDGKRLAYVVQGKLYIAPISAPQQAAWVRTGRYGVDYPSWSPDSKRIAFAADTAHDYFGDNAGVGVVSARGGRVRLIDPGSEASGATWSPDSKWIAYEVYSNLGPSEIRIARPSGASNRLLREVPEGNDIPAWSPQGDMIAIYWYSVGDQSSKMVLYLVRRDGRGLRRIYSAGVANKQ